MFNRPQRVALWSALAIFAVASPILIIAGAYLYRHDQAERQQRVALLCQQTAIMVAHDQFDEAEDAFIEVLRIDPGNSKALDLLAQIRAMRTTRADARPILDRARESLRRGSACERKAQELKEQRLPAPPEDAPPSLRAPFWDADERRDAEVRALGAEAAAHFTEGLAAVESAAARDQTWLEPAELRIELDFRRRAAHLMSLSEQEQESAALQGMLKLAQRMKDLSDQPIKTEVLHSQLAESFPDAPQSAPTGQVKVQSDASEIFLFRYVERQHRLIPSPCSPTGETRSVDLANVDPLPPICSAEQRRALAARTAYPLDAGAFNQVQPPLTLPVGSYLLLLRKPGAHDLRCPIVVRAEETWTQVAIFPASTPDQFVYIPPGPCIVGKYPRPFVGHDPNALPGQQPDLEGYFVGRNKITLEQYVEFLNDGPPPSQVLVAWLGARIENGRVELSEDSRGDSAVKVEAGDADAFCAWYARRYGAGTWEFTLATEFEWEKAARGVDGRDHVWGDRDEPSFHSIERKGSSITYRSDASGLSPADESPYGVRDMTSSPPEFARASTTGIVLKGLFGVAYQRTDCDIPGSIRLVARRVVAHGGGK